MHPHAGHILLPLARAAIARVLGRPASPTEEPEWLREPGASFVTLKQGDRLRGCIGSLRAHRPLGDDVTANAVAAAFRDPRFKPLTPDELVTTRIEVSLLSSVEALRFADERAALTQVEPGVHGVVFEYGFHHSTFLPQVWDELPEPGDFMAHLKQKAGLPPDFWDPEVKLGRYTVSKFAEN